MSCPSEASWRSWRDCSRRTRDAPQCGFHHFHVNVHRGRDIRVPQGLLSGTPSRLRFVAKPRRKACYPLHDQKANRNENCISRGVPVPTGLTGVVVLTVLMMFPKTFVPGESDQSDSGSPYWGRLKMLKNSARNSSHTPSVNGMCFPIPMSICQAPGPRATSRGASPNVPAAGAANAAGLMHSARVEPPGGASEIPGTRSRR
jgi:hypothetical protein